MNSGIDKSIKNIKSSINGNQLWSTSISLSYSLNALNPSKNQKHFGQIQTQLLILLISGEFHIEQGLIYLIKIL